MLRNFKRKQKPIIDPDEIFLDSKNLPEFDTSQFEGRIERPIGWSTFIIFGLCCALVAMFYFYRIWGLEIRDGKVYAEISANNSLQHDIIIAARGVIYDRNGVPLAWNVPDPASGIPKRQYIDRPGFAHLIGYIKYPAKDSSGFYYREEYEPQDGLELYLNEMLSGRNGLRITETDANRDVVSESLVNNEEDGQSVVLSIDSRIQGKMQEAISNLSAQVGFKGGAGVMIDVKGGEIIAMTSFPEYDSSVMTEGKETESINNFFSDQNKPFLNRIVSGLYSPGSVVKPFLAFAALEEGIISPEKKINSTGRLVVPNPYFPDKPSIFLDWKAHGPVNMREAIAVSSNVYFYQIGGGFENQTGLGISKIEKYLKSFGFGTPTNIGISKEEAGNIPNPVWKARVFNNEPWRLGDTYNTSIGQYGMQVTPIQTVRAVAALANGGYLLGPSFIKLATSTDVRNTSGRVEGKAENMQVVREGMRLSVTGGTSKGLDVPYVAITGKTGTAELGSSKSQVNSWTAGFFPYSNPRYAYMIVMERGPATNLIGATFVMRQVIDWMAINTPEYFE